MSETRTRSTGGRKRVGRRLSKSALEAMIQAATVDCYNESEETTGWLTMIEEHLVVPFETRVLGMGSRSRESRWMTQTRSWRCAPAGGSGRCFRSSPFPCRARRPRVPRGSRRTDAGAAADSCHQPRIRGYVASLSGRATVWTIEPKHPEKRPPSSLCCLSRGARRRAAAWMRGPPACDLVGIAVGIQV